MLCHATGEMLPDLNNAYDTIEYKIRLSEENRVMNGNYRFSYASETLFQQLNFSLCNFESKFLFFHEVYLHTAFIMMWHRVCKYISGFSLASFCAFVYIDLD